MDEKSETVQRVIVSQDKTESYPVSLSVILRRRRRKRNGGEEENTLVIQMLVVFWGGVGAIFSFAHKS